MNDTIAVCYYYNYRTSVMCYPSPSVLKNVSFCSKVTVSLRYADLISVLPTRIRVLAWPMHQSKKNSTAFLGSHPAPIRLTYAEDALRTTSLPEGENYIRLISKS